MSINVYLPGPNGIYMDVAEVRIGYVRMKKPFEMKAFYHECMVCEGYWWRRAKFKPDSIAASYNGRWYVRHWIRVEDPPED